MKNKKDKRIQRHAENSRNSIVLLKGRGFFKHGRGTGFFVARDKIATNIHVIAGEKSVSVELVATGTTFPIEGIVAFDDKNDLVLLKVKGEGIPLPIGNSDALQRGDAVGIVGYPGGEKCEISQGKILGSNRTGKELHIKATLSHGNSGGPVLNSKGKIIGVANSIGISVNSGTDSESGESHAIPSNLLKSLLANVGKVEPWAKWQKRSRIRAYLRNFEGLAKMQKGKNRAAIARYNASLKLNPDITHAYVNRAVAKTFLEQYDEAIVDCNTAIRFDLNSETAYINRGNAKQDLKRYNEAIADYDAAIILNPSFKTYHNRGLARQRLGQYKRAMDDYNAAIKLNPINSHTYLVLGNLKTILGDYKAAIRDFDKAIHHGLANKEVYYCRGVAKHHFGKSKADQGSLTAAQEYYQAAITDHTEAIKQDKKFGAAYNGRGWTKYLLGQTEIEKSNIKNARILFQRAISDSNKHIQLKSDSYASYHTRGAVKSALSQYDVAIEDFNKAIELNPRCAIAYYDRGLAKEALGQQKEAKADIEKAKELDPEVGE